MTLQGRGTAERSVTALFLLVLCAFVLFSSSPASAASLIGKDGKIHACYKVKGKAKGSLRVVRSAKAKCPKKWKKVSWYASGPAGPQGESGANGASGETGTNGSSGLPGTNATATVVKGLEGKVTELLNKVTSLETILAGINNQQLKEAIASVADVKALEATVGSLCSQSSALTSQLNSVESALGGLSLNSALTALGGVLNIPALPGPLSSFSCP
ncbi:MAG TPA: collagen-like protein [Solirubrobacterales bacterium]|nr:collagen-like protein [Solirubrobacterales bacterium]